MPSNYGSSGQYSAYAKRYVTGSSGEFLDAFIFGGVDLGSTSLKLCLVAAGEADLYLRLGRDIAASDAVLRAAGGMVKTLAGVPLTYGKPDFANLHFAAWGGWQAMHSALTSRDALRLPVNDWHFHLFHRQ